MDRGDERLGAIEGAQDVVLVPCGADVRIGRDEEPSHLRPDGVGHGKSVLGVPG